MILKKIKTMNEKDLLKLHSNILLELKNRNVIRTLNNPIADYCEWIISQKFGWKLENNSKSGYDCIDNDNKKVQIKCRKIENLKGSRQLGIIRNLDTEPFDYLIAVIFNNQYEILEAYKIPNILIKKYAKFNKYQNGFILQLKGAILSDAQIINITQELK